MENSKEQGKKKILEKDLGTISGGNDSANPVQIFTRMSCGACDFSEDWIGNYFNGKVYECPKCEKMSFHGIHAFYVGCDQTEHA